MFRWGLRLVPATASIVPHLLVYQIACTFGLPVPTGLTGSLGASAGMPAAFAALRTLRIALADSVETIDGLRMMRRAISGTLRPSPY
jgi:hypothetical protein